MNRIKHFVMAAVVLGLAVSIATWGYINQPQPVGALINPPQPMPNF